MRPSRRLTAISDVEFLAYPTQRRLIESRAVVRGISSPFGEGKTAGCIGASLYHAQRNYIELGRREIEVYTTRDTLENCKRSPIPTWRKMLGGLFELGSQAKEAVIWTMPRVHISFFGIADAGDLSKLQGPEPTVIHLEEVCPVEDSERYSAGVSEDVFNIALARVVRSAGGLPLLLVSGNPGTQEHWMYRRLVEPMDGPMAADTPLITKAYFKIPYGENQELGEMARQGVRAAYAQDRPRYDRFVGGAFVPVIKGRPVVEAFSRTRHVAGEEMRPLRGIAGVRGWDGWGEPRCVLGQQLPNGQVRVYEVLEAHSDIRALVPLVQARVGHPDWKRAEVPAWRDMGDCTMLRHDQSAISESAAKVIEEAFGTWFEPGPALWESLRVALGRAFRGSTAEGHAAVVINPSLRRFIGDLESRWHYPKDRLGVVAQKPKKDDASHAGDALANLLAVVQPWQPAVRMDVSRYRAQQLRERARARGYGTPA